MAWDSTRPVPWRRLIREWLLYVASWCRDLPDLLPRRHLASACSSGCSSAVRCSSCSARCWPSSATSARRCADLRAERRSAGDRADHGATAVERPRPGRRRPAGTDAADFRRRPSATRPLHPPPVSRRTAAADTAATVTGRPCVIAIDAGTTGVRSRAVFADERRRSSAYREFTQHFPQPGWVEHDADRDLGRGRATRSTRSSTRVGAERRSRRSASPTSARRSSPGTADRSAVRQRDRVAGPAHGGALRRARGRTGTCRLVRDAHRAGARPVLLAAPSSSGCWPSATIPVDDDLALGTIDSWLLWNLTGGERVTPPIRRTPAARCCSTSARWRWSHELCDLLHVPIDALADGDAVERPVRRHVRRGAACRPASRSSGIAGDQQAALFGQACFAAGHGQEHVRHGQLRAAQRRRRRARRRREGMLTTVAWTLADGTTAYALEGAIFVTGAAVQWLRDGLGDHRPGAPRSARSPPRVADSGGVYIVPAFTGLGQPVVGSVRPRHDRRHHPRHDARPPRAGRRRVDGVPDARRGRRDGRPRRARRSATCASTAARR